MLFPINIYRDSDHRLSWGPEELEALKAAGWSTEKPAFVEPLADLIQEDKPAPKPRRNRSAEAIS